MERALTKKEDVLKAKGSNQKTLEEYEKELKISFSGDYKEYLIKYGIIAYDGHELTGVSNSSRINVVDVTRRMRERNKNVEGSLYVIEDTGIDGIVIWQDRDGIIYRTDYDSKPIKICDSLCEYIEKY